jgi:glycerol-3-phosphate dehydrogenase (NAD(P)+)
MKRFIKRVDNNKRDINKSAYLGDLLVTAYSVFSRNRMLGNMIGKGYTVKAALVEMTMIAEGYYGTKTTYEMSTAFDGEYPILNVFIRSFMKKEMPRKK